MSIAERIYEHVSTLPEPAAREVLDFVEFLENKLARGASSPAPQWPPIVMTFEGVAEMPPFELDRAHLTPPAADPLS